MNDQADLERLLARMEARIERLEGQVSDARQISGSIAEAAERVGCSESKMRELIQTGKAPVTIRLGDQKIVVVWRALERWVETELAEQWGQEAAG